MGGLYAAQEFLKPIALSVLLCFVLAPASDFLERRLRLTRVLSVVAVVILTGLLVGGVAWVVGNQLSELVGRWPEYRGNVERKAAAAREWSSGAMARLAEAAREVRAGGRSTTPVATTQTVVSVPVGVGGGVSVLTATTRPVDDELSQGAVGRGGVQRVEVVNLPSSSEPADADGGLTAIFGYFAPVFSVLGTAAIVAVFVVFMLIQREDLRDRLIRLLSRRKLGLTTEALDDAAHRVSRYLLMLCAVNGTYGVAVAFGLWLIGVPAAVLWGLLCALLRFVPYIGPWIAASFPIALSLAVGDGWTVVMLTAGLFVATELISNNVMEPWLYGRGTGVSPVAVIVSAVFWTWLWGAPGLLMATPLTVCAAVAGKHVRQLRFLSVILGDEPALSADLRYYQRLLAHDATESEAILAAAVAEGGLVGGFEEVALPALVAAERDARRGWLEPDKFRELLGLLRQQVEKTSEKQRAAAMVDIAKGAHPTNTTAGSLCAASVVEVAKHPLPPGRGWLRKRARGTSAAAASTVTATGATKTAGLSKQYPTFPRLPSGVPAPRVLILPARDEPDELAGIMLGRVLDAAGYDVACLTIDSLAGEMVETAVNSNTDLVVISATPPGATEHARYLLKRLASATYQGPIATVLWTRRRDIRRLSVRLGVNTPVPLATTLCTAAELVRQLTTSPATRPLDTPATAQNA